MSDKNDAALTTEERLAALEAKMTTTPLKSVGSTTTDADYIRVPKWAAKIAVVFAAMTLVLMAFTLPSSPLAQSPTPTPLPARAASQPTIAPVALSPLGLTSASRTLGDPNAKIALVEYGDFQCPYCRQFALDAERRIADAYVKTGKASLTYKYLPILDPGPQDGESHWAASAAECANQQGKFWEYHDKLFSVWQGENVGTLTKANLKKYAADLGLDAAKFNPCLDNDQTSGIVQADVTAARQASVRGTPAFFLNGQPFFPRSLNFADFVSALDAGRP